jgi:hypothetical protein
MPRNEKLECTIQLQSLHSVASATCVLAGLKFERTLRLVPLLFYPLFASENGLLTRRILGML